MPIDGEQRGPGQADEFDRERLEHRPPQSADDPGTGSEPRDTASEQERAAAAEAGAIGGESANEDLDPAVRPVYEAGGGEAEGFEQAEDELREHAEHGDDFRRPTRDAFADEAESDRSSAAYGDPDRIDPSEPDLDRHDA